MGGKKLVTPNPEHDYAAPARMKGHKPMDFIHLSATKREDMKTIITDSSGWCVNDFSSMLI